MRSVTLAPTTIASQTEIPRTSRRRTRRVSPHSWGKCPKGQRGREASSQGMTVQGSGERIPYPADVYPHRRAGEATAPAGRKNHGDDGGRSSRRSPEGRRSGDVGGAGLKPQMNLRTTIARDPNTRRCFDHPSFRRTPEPRGAYPPIKRALPLSRIEGRAVGAGFKPACSRGMPGVDGQSNHSPSQPITKTCPVPRYGIKVQKEASPQSQPKRQTAPNV